MDPTQQPTQVPTPQPSPMPVQDGNAQGNQSTNGLAIGGLILAFFIPLVGLILSIVALSQIKKKNQGGRGIAIAGIIVSLVFMVFSVLIFVTVLLTTFSGTQQKSRDVERQTDIKAMYGQVEAYYATNGYYPTLDNMNDSNFRSANLQGLDDTALIDPKGTSAILYASPAANVYSYAVAPKGCTNVPATEDSKSLCKTYTLSATLESVMSGSNLYTKKNLQN